MVRGLRTRLWRAAVLAAAAPGIVRFIVGRIDSSPRTSRRDFLRWTVAGTSTFFLAETAAGFIAFYWPLKIGKFGSKITVKAADIPAVGADPLVVRDGKFWLINNDDGGLALYWKCKHLGCTVPWNEAEGQFHCPCHGSLYDRHGRVVGGPAPAPLDYMAVSFDGNKIVVDTGKITTRVEFEPHQITPLPG